MLGKNVQELSSCQTKLIDINSVNLKDVHGYIFTLTNNSCFITYKFREGPLGDITGVKLEFFYEVIQYL